MLIQHLLSFNTPGRGLLDISEAVDKLVSDSEIQSGLSHIYIHHTSASLILCENADPQVRADLEAFMRRLVPDGDRLFAHDEEGPDDMPAHVRSILTQSSLSIPITGGQLGLGTWQGIYLWEHRTAAHVRQVTVTLYGT